MKERFSLLIISFVLSVIFPLSALAASITVTSPNGGECLIPGSEIDVKWTGEGNDHVAIGHRTDDSTPPTWQQDANAWDLHPVHSPTGSFRWQVPTTSSTMVKIWIESHDATHTKLAVDSSDSPFTISNSCGVEETPTSTGPTIERVVVGDRTYQSTQTVEVAKGTNMRLEGSAPASEAVTIYVMSEEKKFTTTAGSGGEWTFDVFTSDLTEGDHQVDLETASSPRAKALSFRVVPQSVVTLDTQPVQTLATSTEEQSAIRRISSQFPYPLAIGAAVAALVLGLVIYLLLRRRTGRINEPPSEPPQIT